VFSLEENRRQRERARERNGESRRDETGRCEGWGGRERERNSERGESGGLWVASTAKSKLLIDNYEFTIYGVFFLL